MIHRITGATLIDPNENKGAIVIAPFDVYVIVKAQDFLIWLTPSDRVVWRRNLSCLG